MGKQLCVLCPFCVGYIALVGKCVIKNLEQRLNTKFLAKPNEAAQMFMVTKVLFRGV
jgi:hypothetical protein